METFKQSMYNIILVHTARTWERIRIKQPYEEMPLDNIESVEAIEEIATIILDNDIIQRFIEFKDGSQKDWDWDDETGGMGCSDIFIEYLADLQIKFEYLQN